MTLQDIRERAQRTQLQVAAEAKVSSITLRRFELGATNIRPMVRFRLEAVYAVMRAEVEAATRSEQEDVMKDTSKSRAQTTATVDEPGTEIVVNGWALRKIEAASHQLRHHDRMPRVCTSPRHIVRLQQVDDPK